MREIAGVAGVTERTIYKYAARGAWKPRYRWAPDGKRPAAFAPVKGAGGRFIRREDKDRPFARGLKATDPAGRDKALAACLKAARLSRAAQATAAQEARAAQAHRRFETRLRVISVTNRAFADLNAFRKVHAASLRRYAAHLAQQEAAKGPGDEPSKHIGKEPTNGRWPLALIARAERLHMQAVETALCLWRALPE
ncbi:MAG: hypothetical protein Q8M24_21670 [Pseudolabrys sp.]|nr:hypothetical protein [Pseudolabrys sp.]MDP2298059.1 hypothetical protein [Pseudolabrys sp.]